MNAAEVHAITFIWVWNCWDWELCSNCNAAHVMLMICLHHLTQAHTGKEKAPAGVFNITGNHRCHVLPINSGFPGWWNDKSIIIDNYIHVICCSCVVVCTFSTSKKISLSWLWRGYSEWTFLMILSKFSCELDGNRCIILLCLMNVLPLFFRLFDVFAFILEMEVSKKSKSVPLCK